MKRSLMLVLLIITAMILTLAIAPETRGWAFGQQECADYDLTGRMFAISYRIDDAGGVKCIYEGRPAPQCPPVAPDGTVLVKERQRAGDSVACIYGTGD